MRGHPAAAWLLIVVAALLAGCASRPLREQGAWLEERELFFAAQPDWAVSGRVALSDGQRGGSLGFQWTARGDHHHIRLRTPAGGRQWRLEFDPAGARLVGSDVDELIGPRPDPLVEAAVGWPIPIEELTWWIRGLLPPGGADGLLFAADGSLATARSGLWALGFERYSDEAGLLLPARIEAESPPYRVRLVMRDWKFGVQP